VLVLPVSTIAFCSHANTTRPFIITASMLSITITNVSSLCYVFVLSIPVSLAHTMPLFFLLSLPSFTFLSALSPFLMHIMCVYCCCYATVHIVCCLSLPSLVVVTCCLLLVTPCRQTILSPRFDGAIQISSEVAHR
jgi:hypothetical protein